MDANEPAESDTECIKYEAEPVFNMYHTNNQSFENIFNTPDSALKAELPCNASHNVSLNVNNKQPDLEEDDDCVMIIESSIPVPLRSTQEGLTKREADPISNEIPYITTVSNLKKLSR